MAAARLAGGFTAVNDATFNFQKAIIDIYIRQHLF
jgi:hypothetical protein